MIQKIKDNTLRLFLFFSALLAWPVLGILFLQGGRSSPYWTVAISAIMWAPAIAVWITKKISGKKTIMGVSLRPKWKGNIRYYAIAWFLPAVVFNLLVAILYFCLFPSQFDPNMPLVNTQGWLKITLVFLVSSFIQMPLTLGEEIGWRGFLFPELRKRMSIPKAHICSGIIWGLWHAPAIAMGHNFGTEYPFFPWLGILGMCILSIGYGSLLDYVSYQSGSVWPAVLGHATNNAVSALFLQMFLREGTSTNQFVIATIYTISMLLFLPYYIINQRNKKTEYSTNKTNRNKKVIVNQFKEE